MTKSFFMLLSIQVLRDRRLYIQICLIVLNWKNIISNFLVEKAVKACKVCHPVEFITCILGQDYNFFLFNFHCRIYTLLFRLPFPFGCLNVFIAFTGEFLRTVDYLNWVMNLIALQCLV